MNVNNEDMLLYVVTDRSWLGDQSLKEQVEKTVKAGATFVQLREKDLSYEEFVAVAKEIKQVTDQYDIPFVINDNLDVAVAVGADGVHIGQRDEGIQVARATLGKDKIIGLSAHNVEEALEAEKLGADYIGVGAVFTTSTKLDANSVSFDTLKEICNVVKIPVVAIGGINKDNITRLSGSGVDGVAVISAIFAQPDIEKATMEMLELSQRMVRGENGPRPEWIKV